MQPSVRLYAVSAVIVGVIAWYATSRGHEAPTPSIVDNVRPDVERLRADFARQADELARVRSSVDAALERVRREVQSAPSRDPAAAPEPRPEADPPPRVRAELDALSERVSNLERRSNRREEPTVPPANDEGRVRLLLDELKAVTDGRRFVAVEDTRTDLIRLGDAAVPDVLALLDSGFEQDWGGRFETRGLHVDGYPGVRMVLLDVLRQIGTPASKKAFVEALARSGDARDLWALKLYWGTKDTALVDAVAEVAPQLLRLVAKTGLAAAVRDAPDSPVHNLLYWLYMHPTPENLAGPLEEIVLGGRPKGRWNEGAFESMFNLLVRVAPEKAAEHAISLQARDPAKRELVALSGKLHASNTVRARYFTAVFASGVEPDVRLAIYEEMRPGLWRDDWSREAGDPAAQVVDARAFLDLLERRLDSETDPKLRKPLERAIAQLRAQMAPQTR